MSQWMIKAGYTYDLYSGFLERINPNYYDCLGPLITTEVNAKLLSMQNDLFDYVQARQRTNVKPTGHRYERYFHVDSTSHILCAAKPFEDLPCVPLSSIEDPALFYKYSAPTFVSKTSGKCMAVFSVIMSAFRTHPEVNVATISKVADFKKDVYYYKERMLHYNDNTKTAVAVMVVNSPRNAVDTGVEYIKSAFMDMPTPGTQAEKDYRALILDGTPMPQKDGASALLDIVRREKAAASAEGKEFSESSLLDAIKLIF